jgi:hypothetical protein
MVAELEEKTPPHQQAAFCFPRFVARPLSNRPFHGHTF